MDKNTKLIAGVIVIALVIGGLYLYQQKSANDDQEMATTTDEAMMKAETSVGVSGRASGEIESLDQELMNLELPSDSDLSDSSVGL